MPQNPLPTILSWAADEGWNPGLDDAAAFLAADRDGFFTHEIAGKPIAAISVVNHSDAFAFLGLYLCRPEYRGRGLGFSLWKHAISHAGGRTIGLDGVPDQQANYRKSGFVLHGQTVRWQGEWPAGQPSATRPATPADRTQIARWDQHQVGFQRMAFMQNWLSDSDNRRTLVIAEGNEIKAYGTIRRCVSGFKIGPFAAENKAQAVDLMAGFANLIPQEKLDVMIDLPAANPALSDMLAQSGFTPGFETARMYKGKPPCENLARYTAVATLELG